jgi:hypothetical protein
MKILNFELHVKSDGNVYTIDYIMS